MDALSEVLRLARLTGGVVADVAARGAWCASVPAGGARAYGHLLLEGRAKVQVAGGEPVALQAGDFAFLPGGESHLVASDLDAPATPLSTLSRAPTPGEAPIAMLGSGSPRARWIVLAFSWERHLGDSLFSALPTPMRVPLGGSPAPAWLAESLGLTLSGSDAPRVGGDATRERLAQVVLVEALRRHVESLPASGTGWLPALADRHVGAALALVHGRPSENWTVERLGRQVGLSRSALAERFSQKMGEPVIAFLTRVRLQLAAEELVATPRSIEAVSEDAGYESVTAFSRAFKRTFGKPPSVWRQRARKQR